MQTSTTSKLESKEKIQIQSSIRLAGVVKESIVDGPGIRYTIFCQGCTHNCPNCHNPNTHNLMGGYDCELSKIIDSIKLNPLLQGVTFSGGEPSLQPKAFLTLAREIKKLNKNIWMYSGFTLEELIERTKDDNKNSPLSHEDKTALKYLLEEIDVLIDGKYMEELRDLTLLYRGSKNQRIIDMKKTRENNKITLVEL